MTKSGRGRSAKETRALKAKLRALLMAGMSETECMDDLGIRTDHYRWLKQQIIADELQEVASDSPEIVYAKYQLRQEGCIRDLDEIIAEAKNGKIALNTAIGAIKAKATIIDNVLAKGQDLGVIHREAAKSQVSASLTVASVSTEELRALVSDKKKALAEARTKYIEADYSEVPVDEDDVYGEPKQLSSGFQPPKREKVTVEGS